MQMVSLCGLRGEAGRRVRGRWPLPLTLPGGGEPEALPLVIATGGGGEGGGGAAAAGPKLLLTANIHGPDHNGHNHSYRPNCPWMDDELRAWRHRPTTRRA